MLRFLAAVSALAVAAHAEPPLAIDVAHLNVVATVSPGFQSYNIEMAEITGAEFWRPYGDGASATDRYALSRGDVFVSTFDRHDLIPDIVQLPPCFPQLIPRSEA